jgi:hypothetical protein
MAFISGTAKTPSTLLKAMNDLLVANGWTKIRGEEDMVCSAPKAARYWRMVWWNTYSSHSTRVLSKIEWRETAGGPPLSGTWFASSGVASPSGINTPYIYDKPFYLGIDFGSPKTVREFVYQVTTANYSPKSFQIQWSHDNVTWTAIKEWKDLPTPPYNEDIVYPIEDAFVSNMHPDASSPRRQGGREDLLDDNHEPGYAKRHLSEDVWVWEGPGYDASRRVVVMARGKAAPEYSTHHIEFCVGHEYDPLLNFNEQLGFSPILVHAMDAQPANYWFYMNGIRMALVTKFGASDYTSTYAGMMAAFAPPDEYPHPLFISTTMPDLYAANTTNNGYSSMADPGNDTAFVLQNDGTWKEVTNRYTKDVQNSPSRYSRAWVWPYHVGMADRGNWPEVFIGDTEDFDSHFLNQMDATEQGHLPIFPCEIHDDTYGAYGAMDGVFAIPGTNIVPEQTFTIGADTFRVFPNRTRRVGNNWFCVRED